mmetsp:Transcript_87543/g.245921  ORF Transcript_87543/g.245921 Transcript_87543/m.245921 type:complete len:308 (-) Transcript_87543:76-999(-)
MVVAWLFALGSTLAIQLAGLVVSSALATEAFFDAFGGVNFVLLAVGSWICSDSWSDPRRVLATVLFVLSRVWLLAFLVLRTHDRGDARFDQAKGSCLEFAPYWIVQAVWVLLLSLPVLSINLVPGPSPPMGAWGVFWAATFAACFLAQACSDVVKRRWVQEGRPGHFCTEGLWRWSRHPNYFGELGMAIAAACLAAPLKTVEGGEVNHLAMACFLSPAFTFAILMFVSGIPTAEGFSLRRYYEHACSEYKTYRASTPILVPWPCGGYDRVPQVAKQLFCCEWSMYELLDDGGTRCDSEPGYDTFHAG